MESCILRTDKKGDLKVFDMFLDGQLMISLPHRASLTIVRIGQKIILESDLGLMSSAYDLQTICEIDIEKETYPEAVNMNPDFMRVARSFDCDCQVKKFVNAYHDDKNTLLRVSTKLFGDDWLDQAYVHFSRYPDGVRKDNIEFSVIKAEHMNDEKLEEPAMTLVGSLQLSRRSPYYFLFVSWWSDAVWTYRNFFFNNSQFPC